MLDVFRNVTNSLAAMFVWGLIGCLLLLMVPLNSMSAAIVEERGVSERTPGSAAEARAQFKEQRRLQDERAARAAMDAWNRDRSDP